MTRPTGLPVEEFLADVPNRRRWAEAQRLIELMRDVTGAEPVMWGPSTIGFGRIGLGRQGDRPLVAFAPRKQNLVVYLESGHEDRYASTRARLGPHRTGPGCLYLKNLDDVDPAVLRELVTRSTRVAKGVDRASF